MKRLAFWIIVCLVVVNLAGRRRSSARDEARTVPHPSENYVKVVHAAHFDDGDDEDDNSSIVITRGRRDGDSASRVRVGGRQIRIEVPTPPKPPAPPKVTRRGGPPVPPKPPAPPETGPRPVPDWFPRTREQEISAAKPDASGRRVLIGSLSASPKEALESLKQVVRREAFDWLAPELVKIGEPSESELNLLVRETYIQPVLVDINKNDLSSGLTFGAGGASGIAENLYTIYRAGQVVDFSEDSRERIIGAYRHRVVRSRLIQGGGALAFGLICLSALTGYIRTDTATRGNYRRRLGVLTLAATAGAGYALYHWVV